MTVWWLCYLMVCFEDKYIEIRCSKITVLGWYRQEYVYQVFLISFSLVFTNVIVYDWSGWQQKKWRSVHNWDTVLTFSLVSWVNNNNKILFFFFLVFFFFFKPRWKFSYQFWSKVIWSAWSLEKRGLLKISISSYPRGAVSNRLWGRTFFLLNVKPRYDPKVWW